MVSVALIVPVMTNFEGFTRLMASVDTNIRPYVIPNYEENIGVSKAWNKGIIQAALDGFEYAVVANDDIVLEKGCIQAMLPHLKKGWDVVTAVNTRDFPEPEDCKTNEPDYAFFAVRPGVFLDKFGPFDEKFTPAYFEDNDMYRRVNLLGGTQTKLSSARMFHEGSVTQFHGGSRVVSHEMFEKNRAYYAAKWGGVPGEETFVIPFNGLTGKKSPKEW